MMDYLAACCVFRDELPYLREWIEYHRLVGVERFYMISNDSSPHAAQELIKPYIQSGEVIFGKVSGQPFAQLQRKIYGDVVNLARGRARWLAFIDTDEFLLPVQREGVPEILASYEQYAALAVNWACFGSSGLVEAPDLQTAGFKTRLEDSDDDNRIFKSIVDPQRVIAPFNPHRFVLADNAPLVDEFYAPVTQPWRSENNPFFGTQLRINHYRTRSANEFADKVERWRNGGHPELSSPDAVREFWDRNNRSAVVDETIQRFVPQLRQRLEASSDSG